MHLQSFNELSILLEVISQLEDNLVLVLRQVDVELIQLDIEPE